MKKTGIIVRWIVPALCLVLSCWCSKGAKESEWAPTIEVVDGIKVITNPEEPKYGDFSFDLEEDLAIGDVNDEDYFFPRRVTPNVDEEGNIYVCDGGNKRVQKYDKNGKYATTIGREGQGPGEYMYPSSLFLDDGGNPCVNDSRNLIYYTRDGSFQKKIQLKGFYSRLYAGPRGTFFGTTQPNARAEGGAKISIVQIAENGEPLCTIAEYPAEYSESQKAVVLHWYTHNIALSQRNNDTFYYGFSKEYKVHVADAEGRTIFVFAKEEEPVSISGEEKELTKKDGLYAAIGTNQPEKAVVFPDHRPFFARFISDDEGRLYVIRSSSILERDQKIRSVDVFSRDGIYLYRMSWPFIPSLIKKGFLYEVRENEETGDIKVLRHKINNWEGFKGG
jgi:hypothetical protein